MGIESKPNLIWIITTSKQIKQVSSKGKAMDHGSKMFIDKMMMFWWGIGPHIYSDQVLVPVGW